MCSAAGILFLSLNRFLCNYAVYQMILSGGKPYAAWHHIILCTYFLPYRRQFAFLDKPNDQCDHQTDQKICRYPEKARGLFGKVIGIVCLSCFRLCQELIAKRGKVLKCFVIIIILQFCGNLFDDILLSCICKCSIPKPLVLIAQFLSPISSRNRIPSRSGPCPYPCRS